MKTIFTQHFQSNAHNMAVLISLKTAYKSRKYIDNGFREIRLQTNEVMMPMSKRKILKYNCKR